MRNVKTVVLAVLAGGVIAAAHPALAQTTLTMSSWVSPQHHLTSVVDVSYVTASYTPARHVLPLMPELPGAGDTALI